MTGSMLRDSGYVNVITVPLCKIFIRYLVTRSCARPAIPACHRRARCYARPTMSRALALPLAVLVTGCQTFVGIEDVEGHLPYVEGEYLIGIKRARAAGGEDILRLRGTATIDDNRSLTMSLDQLAFTTGSGISENTISGIVFPDGATTTEFDLNLTIQDGAVQDFDASDATISARMRLTLETDFSICAEPVSGTLPSLGSVLIDTETATPTIDKFDVGCDRPAL